jgi:MoaA/NifB/PqqE/SkfB family radical SAM enzyme
MMAFLLGLTTGVLAILLAGLGSLCLRPIRKWLTEFWGNYGIRKGTGLELFLPLERFAPLRIFETMIDEAEAGDEVLVVGRTVRRLIEQRRRVFLAGIQKGLHLKILILNPEGVNSNAAALEALQLSNPATIRSDLLIAIPCFVDICREAHERNLEAPERNLGGSFEVRTCDFIVFNSLTALSQQRKGRRKVILDFSFSESPSDKYQQYYECDLRDSDHFCNKLYDLYRGVYQQSVRYIWYMAGQIHRSPAFIKSAISKEVDDIIGEHSGGEAIRRSDARNFLSDMTRLFGSIVEDRAPPPPMSVQLELTNKCNTKCKHCRRYGYGWADVDEEMSTDRVIGSLEQLANLGVQSITLSGGEPTLRQDLPSILEYAHGQGLKIGVLTNGLEIDPALAGAITRYSEWVRVSLDAPDSETYRNVRGVDGFNQVVESIKRLQEHKTVSGRDCRIGICYSIQRHNILDAKGLHGMIEFVRGLGIGDHALTFKFVHGTDGFQCTPQQLHDFRTKTLPAGVPDWDLMANVSYLDSFMRHYADARDIADGVPLRSFYQQHETRCFTPYLFALIDAFGDVYPCCFLYCDNDSYGGGFQTKRKNHRMGSLSTASFDAIWHGPGFVRMRHDLEIIDVSRFEECKQCTRHYLHNAVLTKLLGRYEHYAREISGGADIFRQVLEQYPPEVVWL